MPFLLPMRNKFAESDFKRVFNFRDDKSTGRSILLINYILVNLGNILVTGSFNMSFLNSNGIDIVSAGIILFIPYIAWLFSVFSPMILVRFKRRRMLLLFNYTFYYTCVVLGTTVMPLFVHDTAARTVCFGILLFLGNLSNALLGSGSTVWHASFLPDGKDRNIFFSFQYMSVAVISMATAVLGSILADSLADSPAEAQIISLLRYIAYAVFIINGLILMLIPKEYPYHVSNEKRRLSDVFSIPLKTRKFFLTSILLVVWTIVCNLNSTTWNYFVLNTLGFKYIYTYISTVAAGIGCIFTLHLWRKAIDRFSWYRMFALTILLTGLYEFVYGFVTAKTLGVYIIISIISGFGAVGTNLVFANLLYMNLPAENRDIYTTYWNFLSNISILAGAMLGTAFVSWCEKNGPWELFGLIFYGSQFLVWIKFTGLIGVFFAAVRLIPHIKPDKEV